MKIIFAILLAQTLTMEISHAQAKVDRPAQSTAAAKKIREQRICKSLLQAANDECDKTMCDQYAEDSGDDTADCPRDGDFMEGMQICVSDDVLPTLIQDLNKRHPKRPVACDDME